MRTLKELAQEALDVQDASNVLGVSRSYAESLVELRQRLEVDGLPCGTDAIRHHPINRLWVYKLFDMAGGNVDVLDRAYTECQEIVNQA